MNSCNLVLNSADDIWPQPGVQKKVSRARYGTPSKAARATPVVLWTSLTSWSLPQNTHTHTHLSYACRTMLSLKRSLSHARRRGRTAVSHKLDLVSTLNIPQQRWDRSGDDHETTPAESFQLSCYSATKRTAPTQPPRSRILMGISWQSMRIRTYG